MRLGNNFSIVRIVVPTFFFRGYKTVAQKRVILTRLLRSALHSVYGAREKKFFESV